VTSQAGHASCLAVGYGGQFIQVVPDLDLVVVITSDVNQPRTNNPRSLVESAVIPAVTH
jgi:CubicO group peptidase (beta-lactamase class C family)